MVLVGAGVGPRGRAEAGVAAMVSNAVTRSLIVVVALTAVVPAVRAEIEKLAQPCDQKICFKWWPRLPELKGWHHDHDHSLHYDANALAPDGFTFADADAVIYARALYKPRTPEAKSLQMLIDADKADFRGRDAKIKIEESKPISTADGQKLRTFEFIPGRSGNWERVAYGEEGDFYLMFTVSARSQQAYKKAVVQYEDLLSRYRTKP